MEWIRQLEPGPRGVYTGCIGGFFADGVTEFNVAIRTLQIHRESGHCVYGTGCGVIWDSDPAKEYAESQLKTAVLHHREPEYELFETMRFEPGTGILRVERHLKRLTGSAAELGFEFDPDAITSKLNATCTRLETDARVRLALTRTGAIRIETGPVPDSQQSMTFQLDTEPTSSIHPELRHKTTRRSIYEQARARCPEAQETLLINERGECMEFCIGSLLIEKDGHRYTPPLSSGRLPGTFRSQELDNGATEKILYPKDVLSADRIYMINSLRGKVGVSPCI
jgi:para-aminobenzoate synthetase/4-amino-4-deoxychorismate lyase